MLNSAADELLVRQHLLNRLVLAIGEVFDYIIPAARYVDSKAELAYSTVSDNLSYVMPTNYRDVEQTMLKACWFYLDAFTDDPALAPDSPLTTWQYSVYLFSQYDDERQDETATPDLFLRRTLLSHNAIVSALINIKQEFQRRQAIPELSDTLYAQKDTMPILPQGAIINKTSCEFVPGLIGHAVLLTIPIRTRLKEC
jgi:hypothetical protein